MRNKGIHSFCQFIFYAIKGYFFIASISTHASTIYACAAGDWSNTATWSTISNSGASCGCIPSSSDSVVIDGKAVTLSTADITISKLSITNASGAASSLQVMGGHTLTVGGNVWVKAENVNKNVEFILSQNSSIVHVQGNVTFERVAANSKSQLLRLNMSNSTTLNVDGSFIFNYLNASGSEGNEEILMVDASVINVTGTALFRMDAGNHFVISQSNTSQINATSGVTIDMNGAGDFQYVMDSGSKFYTAGNLLADIDGGQNFLISMSNNSGTENFKVDGSFTIDKNNAEDVTLDLSNSAEVKVGGDFSFTCASASANNSDFTIALANTSKITVSGNTSATMNEVTRSNCDMIIDMDNTSQFNMGINNGLLAKSCSFTMIEGEILKLEMDRDAAMNVYGNMTFTQNGSNHLQIHLNQNANGSAADAQLRVDGNFIVSKNDGADMQIYLAEDADFIFHKNMTLTYGDSNGNNSGKITMSNTAGITVDSSANITLNCTNQTNNDFTITMNNSSTIKIGPISGPYTTRSFTTNLTNNRDFFINVNSTAILTVYGTFNVVKGGGRNFTINPATSGQITVYNDLDLDNTENADLILFQLDGSSVMDVKGNIDMKGATSSSREQITLNTSSILHIGKNFLRNASPNTYGILNAGASSTVDYDGVASQILAKNAGSGTDGFTYQNLTINNSSSSSPQLTMEGSVSVNGTLTLTNGRIQTTSTNYLEVASGGSLSGGSASSHVIGPLRKTGNAAFTFMVGNGTNLAKIGITAPSSNSTFEAEYKKQAYTDVTHKETAIANISTIEYWTLSRVTGTGTSKVTLFWDDASAHGINDLSNLVVSHYNSATSQWETLGNSATTGGVGSGVSGSIKANVTSTSFSPFTFGSLTSSNPLPVELLYFQATEMSNKVELNWATATEIDNDYFVVERSVNGTDFEEAVKLEGAGNSNIPLEYKSRDEYPLQGTSYYRLKQVDFNGNYTYSALVAVAILGDNVNVSNWLVYPNPIAKNQDLFFKSNSASENLNISIFDMFGKLIYSNQDDENTYEHVLHVSDIPNIATGIYNLVIQTPNNYWANKIIITE